MKSIIEIHTLILAEIRIRQELINTMVGQLYPNILDNEITKLKRMLEVQ
jgi:hypothetical protein